MTNIEKLLAEYRTSTRTQRDTMWNMYLGLRKEFNDIENNAKNRCPECGQNPHNAWCPKRKD